MAVALRLSKKTDLPKLHNLVLITPALQAFDFQTPSYESFTDRNGPYLVSTYDMVKNWLAYGFGHTRLLNIFRNNTHIGYRLWKKIHDLYFQKGFLPRQENFDSYDELKEKAKQKKLTRYESVNYTHVNLTRKAKMEIEKLVINPYFSPLLAPDELLKSLPNVYIMTAEYDPLRDDGFFLMARLTRLQQDYQHKHFAQYDQGFIKSFSYDATYISAAHIANFIHKEL